MDTCVICGGQEFYLESGYYFCKECQTQQEGKREEVVEFNQDQGTRLKKTRIHKVKEKTEEEATGWTSWEKFNFILIGLTNQLIELGASPEIKTTVLQLWATYLGKLEVAFKSTTEKALPKLARRYDKRDSLIIYGSTGKVKKKRVRKSEGASTTTSVVSGASSNVSRRSAMKDAHNKKKALMQQEYEKYMQSQGDESDVDRLSVSNLSGYSNASGHLSTTNGLSKPKRKILKSKRWLNKEAREEANQAKILSKNLPKNQRKKFQETYMSVSYKQGPGIITVKKIWALIHLALRINNEKIFLSDMLRYAREGHLSYYKLGHLLPPEVILTSVEINKLNPSTAELTYRGLRQMSNRMAKFIELWEIPHPNLSKLLQKFCTELQLPGIYLYAERMMSSSPPVMEFSKKCIFFPNYEARTMAIIIVVMKILFGLDGITEYRISEVVEKINLVGERKGVLDSRLFNFREWQRYIECRRSILVNEHLPTKLKSDPSSSANSHLYVKFIQSVQFTQEADDNEKKPSFYIAPQLAGMMKQEMDRLRLNTVPLKEIPFFPPSSTPQYSYLQQLLENPNKDLPTILRQDFCSTKVGYITNPESLRELAAECDIELNYVDTSPHFAEKIVPTFEPILLLSIREQRAANMNNELVNVITPKSTDRFEFAKTDDPSEYLHRKHPGKIVINSKKHRLYNKMQILKEENKKYQEIDHDDFGFDQVYPNGKLRIPEDDDELIDESQLKHSENNYDLILSNFEKQTMLHPVENPWYVEKKFKKADRYKGRFVKSGTINIRNNTEDNDKTENKSQLKAVEEIKIDDDGIADNGCDSDSIIVEEASGDPAAYDSDEISILKDNIELKVNQPNSSTSECERMVFFRPFKEYWLRRGQHFSHCSPHHFRLLERNLPVNFRWLLHECAHVVEMGAEDLYEEVCLVENYFGCVLSKNNNPSNPEKYNALYYQTPSYKTSIKNKWNS